MYDVIVIGAGPAGASAATYLKRLNYNVLVLENGNSNLNIASKIENYYGFKEISGADLYKQGIDNLKALGVDLVSDEVVKIDYYNNFIVKTANLSYEAKKLVLATGKARMKLNVKGLELLSGKGISFCATCDGMFYKNKKIGIVGYNSYMEEELSFLKRFTSDITIFTNGNNYQSSDYKVVNDKIIEFSGEAHLEGIKTENDFYQLDGCFIALGSYQTFDIIKHIGLKVDKDLSIVTDSNYQTNLKGLYAIGDAVNPIKQIASAVASGMACAYAINNDLKGE